MSLLDHGPDVVLVYPEIAGTDDYGTPTRVASSTPVEVRGHVQPFGEAREAALAGQEVDTTYRFITRDFPGGAWAKVVWDGREWDVVGEPKRYRSTPATSHTTVLLSARSARAL